ncbi:chemotaxis protein : Signal transduction histidine kinase, nitrogen specific, NtrB OS=uncultured bacterium GN=ACD_75C00451G0002 PE=4 SV=1: PAS_9: PAS_4: HisKA: HATPase_c [Gemmataceae bacterium]|nr:chemotaxis protein : Signal transduction histidine kinase, nitrogen specific, NtrB OS=uncultured bacterium GN=ACD_75C00451G0002 PE=4 SV=1: PAS_9: PAS_4: HisKA: HATPase_c [Gemmataceae bacterium]VTT99281.1 chemotaxis protein : Signal transduction histidine kinase, nitrogen specific, NtrB OS=uncultured bacterium GN=ACD_75C00451G0002 PE=4 SV=1: PAS_9: PAS_4: HisKA: HATPase_c [Gemmataceae bacterium]
MKLDLEERTVPRAPGGPSLRSIVLARITSDQLAEILDIAEDGIVTVDARQEIVLFNRGAAKLFGYAPDEVVGRPLDVLLPARYRPPHRGQVEGFGRAAEHARLMGERREVHGRRKDGTEFSAEVSISKLGTGDGMLFTAIVRDVSVRKQYEAAQRELEQLRAQARLAAAEARLDAVIRSAQDAIVTLDPGLRVTLFNPAAERVFGCPAAEATGADLVRFLPGGLPLDGPVAAAAPLRIEGRRADGAPVPLEVSMARTEVGGEAVHTLILRDVTERVLVEHQLRETAAERERALVELQAKSEELRGTTQQLWQAARLAGVGELAASIAHELNNPLGTVSLRVEGLIAKTPADDPRRKPLEIIEGEVERMANLVANLLQFSRAGRDQVSTVDVCEEITRTVDLVAHHLRKKRVKVDTQFAAGVPTIHADRQQLRQVFLNLFTNAADAMPEGGHLTPRVRAGTLPGDVPAIVVEVADTGAGIPADLLPRVFDPFFTTKEEGKGTGLGLAICRRIVDQHRGRVEVESHIGQGTTVRVVLPVRPDTNVAGLK